MSGSPTITGKKVSDPLTRNEYDIMFIGIDGEEVKSTVKLGRKIWFDGTSVNE